jgi:hypothetical protein
MALFEKVQEFGNMLNRSSTAGSKVRGSGSNAGGALKGQHGNPYELMYRDNYGYIFGKPMGYLAKTDPNQRVFQKTLLRNNTIVNFVPGVAKQDSEMLARAEAIILKYDAAMKKKQTAIENMQKSGGSTTQLNKELQALADKTTNELVAERCDLRYAVFQQDITGFLHAYQLISNKVGTAVFGLEGGLSRYVTEGLNVAINESLATRGFKVWVEKGTSISESIDNSFTESVLASTIKSASGLVKQARFLGADNAMQSAATSEATEVQSENAEAQKTGMLSEIASRTLSGANYDFPNIFDVSKFNRSYEISFRFVAPYGDNRTVMNHVINPFLFLCTLAFPRQEGPSGHTSPFLVQVDAPGFFSCPMGVCTSFSFRKGGDEMMFNDSGLPLIIEGSLSVTDLYSNLSLPLTHQSFSVNIGTSSFLNTLGGLNLYATMDQSLADSAANFVKDLVAVVIKPAQYVKEEIFKVKRYLGIS